MKLQSFTVDFLTGNTPVTTYGTQEYDNDGKQDSDPSTKRPELTYQNGVNLDDVYSVISKDAASMGSTLEIPGPSKSPIDLSRGTPSPNRDSGIDSDLSPGFSLSNESIAETLSKLDQTAEAVKTKPTTTSTTDKPGTSYLALIARAIISSPCRKLTLGEIYRHIMENNPYYNNGEKSWRGSVRYTLSINECFIKDGKDESGKGNYWAIHPNCVKDFEKGDYRRRQARRRAKKNLKSVSSYTNAQPALMTSRANAAYTPMTSYVYNQYYPGQHAYGYNPQTPQSYTPDLSKETHPQGGVSGVSMYPSATNTAQIHPAFGYGNYPAGYGYMTYPDYYAMESAYRRQYDAQKSQMFQTDNNVRKSPESSPTHSGQTLNDSSESCTANTIQIV